MYHLKARGAEPASYYEEEKAWAVPRTNLYTYKTNGINQLLECSLHKLFGFKGYLKCACGAFTHMPVSDFD